MHAISKSVDGAIHIQTAVKYFYYYSLPAYYSKYSIIRHIIALFEFFLL